MINVLFTKVFNRLINELIVTPRVVNQQSLDFNGFCEYLADGSTVTAGDVAAVMKLIETRMPLILSLNSKVVCSPEGLTFRPKVLGSITQSQLKAKLEARKAAETDPEKAAKIDTERELQTSDLAVSDLEVSIGIELPKVWIDRFVAKAGLKRVNKASADAPETGTGGTEGTETGGSGSGTSGSETGGSGSDNTGDQLP